MVINDDAFVVDDVTQQVASLPWNNVAIPDASMQKATSLLSAHQEDHEDYHVQGNIHDEPIVDSGTPTQQVATLSILCDGCGYISCECCES